MVIRVPIRHRRFRRGPVRSTSSRTSNTPTESPAVTRLSARNSF